MFDNPTNTAETLVETLIQRYEAVVNENQQLKHAQTQWQHERDALLHKNQLASQKVEAIIAKLKHIETSTS